MWLRLSGSVDQRVVERSNQIHARLKRTAARHPDLLGRLSRLPMVARYRVGAARVGVVHGDADALAGWRFDVAAWMTPLCTPGAPKLSPQAEVDVFASTHTCLPATRSFDLDGIKLIANNGAAGMPNARGTRFGMLTRIGIDALASCPSLRPHRARRARRCARDPLRPCGLAAKLSRELAGGFAGLAVLLRTHKQGAAALPAGCCRLNRSLRLCAWPRVRRASGDI